MTATSEDAEVKKLRREAEKAAAAVDAIEERILDGDPTVTPADLLDAEAEAGHRQSLLERALDLLRRRDERSAERARLERIAEMQRLLAENWGKHEGDLIDQFDAAVEALTPFVAAALERNRQLREIRAELLTLRPLPASIKAGEIHGDVTMAVEWDADPLRIDPLNVDALVAEVALRALAAAGAPHDQLNGPAQVRTVYDAPILEAYELERGDLFGPSDQIRRLARRIAPQDGDGRAAG